MPSLSRLPRWLLVLFALTVGCSDDNGGNASDSGSDLSDDAADAGPDGDDTRPDAATDVADEPDLPDLPEPPELPDGFPTAEDWMTHLEDEVMPYWMVDEAFGVPEGNFPTFRCDDGTLPDASSNRCPELYNTGWIASEMGRQYMRMLSRQTYAYGVAYHLTGVERYFELHLAGVEQIRTRALDPAGGAYTYYTSGDTPGPASSQRTSQDLSYAALGLAMNVYLTRDPAVLDDLLDLKDFIFDEYWDDDLGDGQGSGMLRWTRSNAGGERELVAQLDQINAYMLLLARVLPESDREAWDADIDRLVQLIIDDYYSESENLFWGTLDNPTLGSRHTDFGHTIKSFWMIYLAGRLAGDAEREAWAAERIPGVLERAYQTTAGPYEGLWAAAPRPGGAVWPGTEWWSYIELDQAAATLALQNPATLDYLDTTYPGYFDRMVDDTNGGIYHEVAGANTVNNAKAHQWKNGFHELEHILIGYITGQALRGEEAELWFAFDDDAYAETAVPYYFEAIETDRSEEAFDDITGYAPTVVTFEYLH